MKNILIAGGTGLIGIHLSRILRGRGYMVEHLSRRANPTAEFPAFAWNPDDGTFDKTAFDRADAIVNLAGAGIAERRWTAARKKLIIESRTMGNKLIANYLRTEMHHVEAYVSTSAIGFYGDRADEILTEKSVPATHGFLSESTVAWEQAINEVRATGVRTVAIRTGVVLSKQGGALEKILIPFLFRCGVYFGNGRQWVSWIHIEDLCNLFVWSLENPTARGTYNGVAPTPLSNWAFTKAVSTAKGGGYLLLPAPSFALRLFLGEMADTILGSARVSAQLIESQGFRFVFPEAVAAVKDILKRKI